MSAHADSVGDFGAADAAPFGAMSDGVQKHVWLGAKSEEVKEDIGGGADNIGNWVLDMSVLHGFTINTFILINKVERVDKWRKSGGSVKAGKWQRFMKKVML